MGKEGNKRRRKPANLLEGYGRRLWPVLDASRARIVHLGQAVDSMDWDDPVNGTRNS